MMLKLCAVAAVCLWVVNQPVNSQADGVLSVAEDEFSVTSSGTTDLAPRRIQRIYDVMRSFDFDTIRPTLMEIGENAVQRAITRAQGDRKIRQKSAAFFLTRFNRRRPTVQERNDRQDRVSASIFNGAVFNRVAGLINEELRRTSTDGFRFTIADRLWLQCLPRKEQEDRTPIEEEVFNIITEGSQVPVQCPSNFARFGERCNAEEREAVFRSISGRCNNLRRPELGTAHTPFARFRPAQYDDGEGAPRTMFIDERPLPNARDISLAVHPRSSSGDLDNRLSHYVMQWGQILDHDLALTPMSEQESGEPLVCCEEDFDDVPDGITAAGLQALNAELAVETPECFSISVDPVADEVFNGRTCQPLIRSTPAVFGGQGRCGATVREQENAVTAYIDGSQVYGSNEEEAERLRRNRNGRLLFSTNRLLPRRNSSLGEECVIADEPDGCFLAGDERVNEQPGLITIHTLLVREHNRIANFLRDNSDLSSLNRQERDEILFQTTRKIVIAQLQKITYADFLPILVDTDLRERFNLLLEPNGQFFTGYSARVDPTVRNEFATAAYRLGHTLIRANFTRANRRLNTNRLPSFQLRNVFESAEAVSASGGVNSISAGLTVDASQTLDRKFTTEVADHLFGNFATGPFAAGMDLIALNIQRGRDHGIPGYGSFRRLCGASLVKPIDETFDAETVAIIRSLYGSFREADLFTAGISELKLGDGLLGPTFACILARQFQALKVGDRFYFETADSNVGFNIEQLDAIRNDATLSAIICNNTPQRTIQENAFLLEDATTNPRVNCDTVRGPSLDLFTISL